MAWTDERIALLKQYWDDGLSASQIAELMGENLSRNAVIGKAHRLGLASRPSPLKTSEPKPDHSAEHGAEAGSPAAPRAAGKAAAAPPETPKPAAAPHAAKAVPLAAAPPANPEPLAPQPLEAASPRPARAAPKGLAKGAKVTLLDLNDRICKWPIGHPDEAGFHFCGKPVNPGFPYCGEHCLVAYQAQMPRRDRPGGPSRPFGPNLPRPR